MLRRRFSIFLSVTLGFTFTSCFQSTRPNAKRMPAQEASQKVTIAQIGSEFGMSERDMKVEATKLADFLERKTSASKICPDDPGAKSKKLCALIEKISKKDPVEPKAKRQPIPRLTKENLGSHQSLSYAQAQKALSKTDRMRVQGWTSELVLAKGCPRTLSMAAIRKLEENLPDPEAFKAMEALYGHVSECLKPADDYYEITHFRQALLRSLFGDPTGAKAAINSAYLATKNEERGRVLYWLGILDPSLKEKAWGELVEKQPLTYHALQVWKQTGKDPLEKFNLRPEISVSRSIEGLSSQTADDLRWLESLYLISRASAAERFTKWMMAQADDPIPASAVIYIGSLKAGEENHHNAIKFLTERIVKNPSVLSPQVLRLLYPAPYFETFDRNSSGIDIYLVMGLARQESAFNASARSPARAQGLMQILPVVARVKEGRHKPKPNLLNVETNVRIGTKLLRDWIDQFGGVEFALAAYNAGPRRVPDWRKRYPTSDISLFIDLIPFKETRNYVGSILRNNYWYHRLYDNDPLLAGYKKNNTEPHNRNSQLVLDILAAHKSSSDTDGPSTSSP